MPRTKKEIVHGSPAKSEAAMTHQQWLTPSLKSELEWLAGEAPPNMARHARIVLGRARGMSIPAVAATVGVHPNTVRNCMHRFETKGLHGLLHAGVGKPKNVAFSDAVRDEIARVAMHSPVSVNEAYGHWSLRRLRAHLYRRGVVQSISVEGLRQLLRGLPLPAAYWRRAGRPLGPLTGEMKRALESLAQGGRRDRSVRAQIVLASGRGLNETEIASALHLGRVTVRRWLRRFRRFGILGLYTLPSSGPVTAKVRNAVVRVATSDPGRYGVTQRRWTLRTLHATLVRRRIVRGITPEQVRRILAESQVSLPASAQPLYQQRSPAVG